VFETCLPPLEHLVSILPIMTPRTYSIASSPDRHPNTIHLIVVAYTWNTPRSTLRWGLCTSYLFRLAASSGESESASVSSAGTSKVRPLVALRTKHIPHAALEAVMGEGAGTNAPQEQVQMAGLGVGMVPFSLQKRDDILRPGPKWVFGRMHGSIMPH
jgi:sulfite reductase alpha subunit-like flavoprotein